MSLVRTYEELTRYVGYWHASQVRFLTIHGRGGTGKTCTVVEGITASRAVHRITGYRTPMAFYAELYEYRQCDIHIDDADILKNDKNIVFMKMATDPEGIVAYGTTSSWLEANGIPEQFKFEGRIVLTVNEYKNIGKNMNAVDDRAFVIHFDPTMEELLKRMGEVFRNHKHVVWDAEVYDFIVANSPIADKLSLRTYEKGVSFKKASVQHWKKDLLREMAVNEKKQEMIRLLTEYKKDTERLVFWTEQYSRADYYRWKKEVTRARGKKVKL